MAGPFKMKGFGGFGNSPLKQKRKGVVKPKKQIKVGKLVHGAASTAAGLALGHTGIVASVPGLVKRGVQYLGGKRTWTEKEDDRDFSTSNKLVESASRHIDNVFSGDKFNTGAPSHKNKKLKKEKKKLSKIKKK